ncbi:MAG: hypothetical protein JRH01_17150 [Deltaproteobacteria bacterium]|nr:hypothetical protein [Deltaproteobacteria bacterium]MBW2392839.1 hypothetical protein [Deltaproteobacteria bacterium]
MTQIEFESQLVVAREFPLPLSDASSLARQPVCAAAVKLALDADGRLELRAEILRRGGRDAAKLARDALDVGRAWLADAAKHPGAHPGPDEVEGALEELPRAWAWGPAPEGGFHVHATGFGVTARVAVHLCPGGAHVVVCSSLPAEDIGKSSALADFALRANRRLRLARISIDSESAGSTGVSWDAFIVSDALDSDLCETVEAVLGAHAATQRSLRALCEAPVAAAYLAMHR